MSNQEQNFSQNSIQNSNLQFTQAEHDAISIQNSSHVTIVRNIYIRLFEPQPSNSEIDWDWAKRVIKAQQAEVRTRLKDVLLRDQHLMSVQMLEQPEQVNRSPLESERRLTIAGQDSELLDPGQLMIEVFGRGDIDGKLLILGSPGAGKTTVLLSLAEQVLVGAIDNPRTVIPIVFELSTWKNDNQSIHDWLIEQLYDLYGGDRKLKRYEQWVEQRVLLPLLDGLDELGMERQKKCMAKLNEFTKHYPQVVVCCRSKEFEEAGIRLKNLRGAVCLEPLSDRQIQTYLHQVQRERLWTQIQETPEMRQMLEPNDGEAGLLRVPLFVSIAASIYDVKQPFQTKGELLERYIDRQLSFDVRMSDRRRGLEQRKWAYAMVEKEPIAKATRKYLVWLARRLNEINQVNFLIEKMQPGWLEKPQHKCLYRSIVTLLVVLLVMLLVMLSSGLNAELLVMLLVVLLAVLSDIRSIDFFQISLSSEQNENIRAFRLLLLGVLVIVMLRRAHYGMEFGLTGMEFGLIGLLMLCNVLIYRLVNGMDKDFKGRLRPNQVRSHPNQDIWNSLRSVIWVTAFSYPAGIILSYNYHFIAVQVEKGVILDILLEALPRKVLPGALWALFFGILAGGGLDCIRHFCLRFILWQNHIAPWNMAQFLDYCTERRLLQRIGGRYRFIHRELLDHLAKQGNFGF